jgi:hypothetical protein
MSFVLLLTATIKPFPLHSKSGRTNSIDREDDYFKAVKFYLEKGYLVVFVENSNYDSLRISSLAEKYPSLEYHSFLSQKSNCGKSFGEIEIIEYAIKHSNFLKEVDYLIKITGRYIIKNINFLLDKTNSVEHEIYINPTRNFSWADTRIIIIKKSYYFNYFLPTALKHFNEKKGSYLEIILMRSLLFYMIDGGILVLWPIYPAYDAIDGTHDEKVSFSTFKKWKYNLYYKLKKFVFKHRA